MATATKEKRKTAWKLSQDDYIDLLRSVEKNSQTILTLTHEVNRLKGRMGLGVGI